MFDFRPKDDFNEPKPEFPEDFQHEKIGFKDLLALVIAQYTILLPMVFVAVIIATLVMLFVTRVWLK
ncbi:hypothetical protein [Clostridium polynesiense]|uniref:hypothetical protein n=1 Tax=Clostridium polynesiense TaxID=1325933 RepID=UPI000590F3F7|nr:hypothetical protein [Clostridium polynesiense]